MFEFRKKHKFSSVKFLVVSLLIFLGMIAYLWEQSSVLKLSKREAILLKEAEDLRNRNIELRSEISRLSKSDRISKIASDKLGMVFPERGPLRLEEGPLYGRGRGRGWISSLPAGLRKLSVISKYLTRLNPDAEASDR